MAKYMAKTTSKSDKKLKKAIDKREPGEWSLKWANPFTGTLGECDCDSVWQTKETTLNAKLTVYLRSLGTQTV